MAELVGDLLDGESGVGYVLAAVWRSRLGVQCPSMPIAAMTRSISVRTSLGSVGLAVAEVNTRSPAPSLTPCE